jgi:replication factor C subunit 1
MNIYRAVMITGSPGIGKTTSAHLCAKLEGFTVIELNASDSRSKKLVEVRGFTFNPDIAILIYVQNGMNINNTSLDGWMGGQSGQVRLTSLVYVYVWFQPDHLQTNAAGVAITDRSCIIMDEVDGMSAGDRGGVGALNALIKKTKVSVTT